jgi:hypothetical protein
VDVDLLFEQSFLTVPNDLDGVISEARAGMFCLKTHGCLKGIKPKVFLPTGQGGVKIAPIVKKSPKKVPGNIKSLKTIGCGFTIPVHPVFLTKGQNIWLGIINKRVKKVAVSR